MRLAPHCVRLGGFMGYSAEALVSAPPPPSKPAAAKNAPPAAQGPSFGDHLAAETDEPTPAASSAPAARAEQSEESSAPPTESATDEPAPEQNADASPQPVQHPAPTPIASPVLVQLIASDALPVENTTPVQAAPIAPDAAPDTPQAPALPPAQNATPDIDTPTAEVAPPPASHAKAQSDVTADATPTPETKPQEKMHEKSVTPQTPVVADVDAGAGEAAPTQATPPANAAPRVETNTATPPVIAVAAPAAPTPRTNSAKAITDTGESAEAAPIVHDGEAAQQVAPAPSAAPRPVATDAPVERVAADAPADDASVQEKFAAALEKSAPRGEAKANVDHAPAAQTQIAAEATAPALVKSAAPESMSATAPINALSAATTHAAAQTQAMNADHVSRAAPASTQVAQEIVRRFDGGNTKFELRLDPPELGRVEVRLEVTRDHKVTAVVAADSPQALTELARHARELEQSLQSAGLELTDNGLSFDLRQSREDGQESGGESGRGGNSGSDDETLEQATPLARPIGLERWRGVRVDVMA